MTEADFEYLLRTLSEAQSRATEIAIGVRGRVGIDHRLSDLGNSAVSQIESVLRDIRRVASEESTELDSERIRPTSQAGATIPARRANHAAGASAPPDRVVDLSSEHWFPAFVDELLERYGSSGGITFETVECILQKRKEAFAKDLETARRMYRSYPHLFPETAQHP
jgi:hypothetical protein